MTTGVTIIETSHSRSKIVATWYLVPCEGSYLLHVTST